MFQYERIDPHNPDILSITRLGHFERYHLAHRLLSQDSIVLDAACGHGYGAEIMARKAAHVIALDCHEETIISCREKYRRNNLEFIVGNVYKMPFPDQNFDSIVAIEMIEHIESPELFLAEAYRLLKHDGKLMISTPYGNNTLPPSKIPHSKFHVKEYTFNEVLDLFEISGFDLEDYFGQYVILGKLIQLTQSRIKPVSNVKAGKAQAIMESIPMFASILSKHYRFLRGTSKNMFYYASKNHVPV